MKCEEAQELITALVDEEISEAERSSIDSHLKDCPRCRFRYEQEGSLKKQIRAAGAQLSVPGELRRKILADQWIFPTAEGLSRTWKERFWPAWPLPRPALALGLGVIIILPLLYLMRTPSEPISLAALEVQKKIIGGEVSIRKASNRDDLRGWLMRAVEGKFAPMEYDLSAMKLEPQGGTIQELNGRKMLVTVYTGAGLSVTCFTFLGTEEDAPKTASVFFDPAKKIRFYGFSKDGFNAVLHREGNVLCIVVSKMPMDDLFAMVRAKAHPS